MKGRGCSLTWSFVERCSTQSSGRLSVNRWMDICSEFFEVLKDLLALEVGTACNILQYFRKIVDEAQRLN